MNYLWAWRRSPGLQDGGRRGLCFAGPGDADRVDSAFRDVKRRILGDAKPSQSAECLQNRIPAAEADLRCG